MGSSLCSSMTAAATLVPPPSKLKFLALWHSSKTSTPSQAAPPSQATNCCRRLRPLVLAVSVE